MSIINKFPDVRLHQPASNWQIFSTDGTPVSVLPIALGQQVFCSDGHPGRVTHLLPGIDGQIGALVIQTRGWWRRKVVIPTDYIDHIDEEIVYLSISKSDLKKLPTYRADNVLVAAVIQSLWEDTIFRRTEYRQIHVEVEHGIAYLSGYVSSPSMSTGAEKAALMADGIWKVDNDLAIDSEMKLAVSQAIGKDPRTKKARIFVGVNNGFVTLTGEAPDLAGHLAAQEQAVAIPKVRGVLNSIRVPGVDINTDDQRALQPIIGAGIYATDILIGVVEKVVINPDNRLVTAILANAVFPDPTQMGSNWLWNEHRYTERRIIIPIDTIRHQSESDIFLKVKSREAAALKAFDTSSYASPDENWQPPYPYKRADILIVRHAETSR
jgi:osmotically-inducible protein OsmY